MKIRAWLLLAAAAALTPVQASQAEIIEQVIVKVNGDIITKTEFEQRQVSVLRARNREASRLSGEALRKAIADITPQLIVEAVDELLLLQRGRELGYKMNDQQYQQVVEQIRKENRLESDEAFQAALKQEGLTPAELRKSLERQMIVSYVQRNEVMQKIAPTEEEQRKYYEEHREQFTKPGTVTLREIFVPVPASEGGVNVAADEEAKRRIDEIRARVMKGEDFAKLATELSEAPSRANGGLIGPLALNELTPELQQMLAGLKPGDVSGAFRTPRGYSLFKFESATEPEVLAFEEARDEIWSRIWEQRRPRELEKYLARLRSQSTIEWKNEELRKAFESAVGKTVVPGSGPDPASD
jgi:parvulin-like peptidyl-prolyl isomerase